MPDTCPFCHGEIHSITTRRLTPNLVACRTCGDKILPIIHQVEDSICNTILDKLDTDTDTTLTTVLRLMLDDELNIYVPTEDDRRRIEASL